MTVREALKRGAPYLEELLLRLLPEENRFPPLFIVGAPRCGTTIVSLHLINTFTFSYFPNASKHNPRYPLLAACWARLREKYEPTTENRYGIVDGSMAPSDGWDIFHRWFPRYDHSEPVDTGSLNELRRMVFFLERLMGGPFANKNNNNSTRIRELSQLFPQSLFIHVRRNPRDAIASLIRARMEHEVPPDGWWSVAPPQCYDTAPVDTVGRSVLQVCEVDDYIRSSLHQIPESRFTEVHYKSFCEQPSRIEAWVERAYEGHGVELKKRSGKPEREKYAASSSWDSLSTSTQNQIEEILSRHEDYAPKERLGE
jgi:hypothetical protein